MNGRSLREAGDGNLLVATVSWLVCLLLAWVLLTILVSPTRPFDHVGRGWTWVGAVVVVVVLLAAARWGRRPVEWLEERPWVRRGAGVAGLALAAVVMLRLGMAVRFPPGWDAGIVEEWAYGLAHGEATVEDHAGMANRYPNNVALVAWLARWYQLCDLVGISSMGMGAVVLNVITLTVALVLVWTLARRLGGPTGGYLALVLAVPLLVVSPWIGVAYSDTLGTVFPIGIVLLFLVARDSASAPVQVLCWTGVGVLALVGYRLKPTVVIALVAVLAAVVVELRRGGTLRTGLARLGRAVLGLSVGLAIAYAVLALVVGRTGLEPEGEEKQLATPLTHFLMMGAGYSENSAGTRSWGGWNGDDVALTESVPPEERFDHSLGVWRDRVQAWGPVGYPRFLNEKAAWMLGDGNFNAFLHGHMNRADPAWEFDDALSRQLRPWLTIQHEEYRWLALVRQSVWLGALLLVAVPAFRWRRGTHAVPTGVLRLSLLGLLVFLLLFEGGSRYLYLYVPLVLVLAAVSAVELGGVRQPNDRATESRGPGRRGAW